MPLPSAWQTGLDLVSHPMGDPLVLAEMELGQLPNHSDADRRVEEPRRKSLHRMSQQYRGITLQELKELRDENNMREQRWFCINYPLKCKFSRKSDESPNGPCPSCGAESGKIRAKNLYELVNDVVKPKCQEQQISYVEFLKGRDGRAQGRKVQTFVSHWWGEEFKDFVESLDRYATNRCIGRQRLRLWTFCHSAATLLLNFILLQLESDGEYLWEYRFNKHVGRVCLDHPRTMLWLVSWNASITMTIFVILILEAFWNRNQAKNWTFWICAFANNQYKLEHALGKHGNLESSAFATALRSEIESVVCIIDPKCVIYTRIWCAFELFYVKCVLRHEKQLPMVLINEKGVISEGGLSGTVMHDIQLAIKNVRTAEAEATEESDKQKINEYIRERGHSYAELDDTLKDLTNLGLDNASLRRRALLIFFFLCPITSFVTSDFIWWCIMCCRIMCCRLETKDWAKFTKARDVTLGTVVLKLGFYFFASLFSCALILLASLSSVEISRERRDVDVERETGGPDEPEGFIRRDAIFPCWKDVKEIKMRLSGPSLFSRLQHRVMFRASMTVLTLMGPGILPSIIAGILLPLMENSSEYGSKLDVAFRFLWVIREVWNVVQMLYAIVGLALGIIYSLIRDRKIGQFRSFLEDTIL